MTILTCSAQPGIYAPRQDLCVPRPCFRNAFVVLRAYQCLTEYNKTTQLKLNILWSAFLKWSVEEGHVMGVSVLHTWSSIPHICWQTQKWWSNNQHSPGFLQGLEYGYMFWCVIFITVALTSTHSDNSFMNESSQKYKKTVLHVKSPELLFSHLSL